MRIYTLSKELQESLIKQGFNYGKSGAHSARSMMINELIKLFEATNSSTSYEEYQQAIVTRNVLQKTTENSRKLTLRHLKALYGLSPQIKIFLQFRQLWDLSENAQPVLALQLAVARDPLLRGSVHVIKQLQPGDILDRDNIEEYLMKDEPDRFSQASLKSFTRNINATWTQAGFLEGRAKKFRTTSSVNYVNIAFALFLAHCHGLSGQRMFDSEWCKLLDRNMHELYELAHAASLHGLIKFKKASEVVEVTFPNLKLEG